jgi:hypothetical protein
MIVALPLACFVATVRMVPSDLYNSSQKTAQILIVWAIPIVDELHDNNEGVELLAQYAVYGIAACRERITVRFQTTNDALTDIALADRQTCL